MSRGGATVIYVETKKELALQPKISTSFVVVVVGGKTKKQKLQDDALSHRAGPWSLGLSDRAARFHASEAPRHLLRQFPMKLPPSRHHLLLLLLGPPPPPPTEACESSQRLLRRLRAPSSRGGNLQPAKYRNLRGARDPRHVCARVASNRSRENPRCVAYESQLSVGDAVRCNTVT